MRFWPPSSDGKTFAAWTVCWTAYEPYIFYLEENSSKKKEKRVVQRKNNLERAEHSSDSDPSFYEKVFYPEQQKQYAEQDMVCSLS